MASKKQHKSNNLRKKAEEKLQLLSGRTGDISSEDLPKIVHELEVHQIELEMQNEELRRTQVELEKSRSKYSDLYDFAPVGYFTFDKQGLILDVNLMGASLLDTERHGLINKPFSNFIDSEYRDEFYLHRRKVFDTGERKTCEVRLIKENSVEYYIHMESIPVQDGKGNYSQIRTAVSDITVHRKAEDELQKAKSKYEDLYENAPDMFVSVDAKTGMISECNQTLAKALQYAKEEIIGRPVFDMYHPDCMDKAHRAFQSFVETGVAHNWELQLQRKDGSVIDVMLNVSSVQDEKGNILYSRSVWRDITDIKTAEKSALKTEKRYENLLQSISDGVLVLDCDWKYRVVNDALVRMLDMKREDLENHRIMDVFPGIENTLFFKTFEKVIESSSPQIVSDAYTFEDGRKAWYEVHAYPLPEGIFVIVSDITERIQAENKITTYLGKLEKANKDLNEFAYIVSHDLKEPLRAVHSLASWIAVDYADLFDNKGKEKVHLLMSRVRRTNDLVEGILRYSQAGHLIRGEYDLDLNLVVSEAIEIAGPPENIQTTIDNTLPTVRFERSSVTQIFQNLIGNAVKYMSKPEGEIKISAEDAGTFWKICVSDNGPGIEEKDYGKIFQMFGVLQPRDKVEASGVGLAIVKKIVELSGGKVWVESDVGRGSNFYFTLPK